MDGLTRRVVVWWTSGISAHGVWQWADEGAMGLRGRWEGERCCEVHMDTLGVFFGRRLASTLYVVLFVL